MKKAKDTYFPDNKRKSFSSPEEVGLPHAFFRFWQAKLYYDDLKKKCLASAAEAEPEEEEAEGHGTRSSTNPDPRLTSMITQDI